MAKSGNTLKIQVLKDWIDWMKTTKGKTQGKNFLENNLGKQKK